MNRSSPLSSIAASALFAVLAVWTLAPVLEELQTSVPGTHLGDNATGLWNVWWFGHAVQSGQPLYETDELFAPFGTQLSLHTHATTHSALAWLISRFSSDVAAHNLAILVGLALNGFCVWLLAYRLTGGMVPALVAGVLFACSAHVQLRVLGHINLVHAWVLPLFALALVRFERSGGLRGAGIAGAAGALVIYTDYYYAVYAALLCLLWYAARMVTCRVQIGTPRAAVLRGCLLALILISASLIAMIGWTGGTTLDLGSMRISARGIRNPLTALWILSMAWGWLRFPVSLSVHLRDRPDGKAVRRGLVALGTTSLLAAPLLFALAGVIAAGDYTAPRVLWRSSPAGADALTLLLGHPLHVLTGRWTMQAYDALDIDVMEQSLWLGLLPLGLILVTVRQWRQATYARLWIVVALVFFVASLGPFLRVGGLDTAMPLPHALLRYLPVAGNARIPGRAIIMVNLAVAVLTAVALSNLASRSRRVPLIVAALLIVVEALPAPTHVQRLPPRDAIDERLAMSSEPGAVAELPTGLRDGFGQAGSLDDRALVHQLWHGRPLVGGFVARLSNRVSAGYAATPILANLIDLSTPGKDARLMGNAAQEARQVGIAYLIVNRDTFIDARLPRSELEGSGFQLVEKAGSRELYARHQPEP